MAMNRTLGMEAQKMQDYVQEQIERRERRGVVFSDEIKEDIFDYAHLIGNEDSVRKLVRDLADAISESQEEKVEDLLYVARQEIQELPDPTVGKLELIDYGYTADNMVPLRKEAALEYHRTGSKIYCLTYGEKELEVEISSDPKSDFEIANFIMYHTMLPRLAIFKILQGVTKRELLNNQDILDDVTQLIKGILNDTKAANITSYEVINGYELDERIIGGLLYFAD